MHVPDGFYSTGLCLALDAACLGVLAYCIKKVWGKLNHKTILLAASVGAFVFALEMAKIPVTKGSSCHLMGGVFASITLGPFLATIVVTLMHLVQFLIFQDGGLLALGPNLLTIAIVSTLLGYYLYRTFKSMVIESYGTYVGAFISAWLTLLITSITVSVLLAISGVDSLLVLIGPMVGPHAMIGVIEGAMTVALLGSMAKICPGSLNLLNKGSAGLPIIPPKKRCKRIWFFLLVLALLTGVLVSPFASRRPEGLEKLALDGELLKGHEIFYYSAPLAGYELPVISNARLSKGLAGLLGVLATFAICWCAGMVLADKREISKDARLERSLTIDK
ncbi:MAG: energy-coupling factor ABC transporter permease [bacterium]